MFSVSVVICSHNPREDYLRRVLDALKTQTMPAKDWELLLVDNASETPLAGRVDLSWHPHARHVREEKVGLTPARLRGIAESQGHLLMFVDDDNVLRPDYLEAALKIADEYPQLGAWGGSCIPEYETEPPAELRPWLHGLVIEKVSEPIWAKQTVQGLAVPPGAGMTVRRRVAEYYLEEVSRDPLRQSLDRSGKRLGSGGDNDLALSGFGLNLGTGRFPQLELTHLIPARRLTVEYLQRLFEGFGYAGVILMAVHDTQGWGQIRYPHLYRKNTWRPVLLWLFMVATRKSRTDRRIKIAQERGAQAALRDLARLGDFRNLINARSSK